ncbi:ABC transporter substrate-binding protein [Mangrovicoccus sp. HB161399]|uniref:ABC transporter substrate-binding protein n=1 Tax=Mangrovicoccus sp. HB161399 TaxID=2720392 RepID=UPI00155798F6|nr:ABC transporter substrate-binding protein [Mangrovicoccus sp. HB161399]
MKSFITAAFLALIPAIASADDWDATLEAARGRTVHFHAWGGDERTNAFISWVGDRVEAAHGVTLRHVKLGDTAEAVARVLAEKAAGRGSGGSVDLIWINGPNFAAMKEQGLLYGPFAGSLPNARWLDLSPGSANVTDFTVPVEGLEAPWRLAKFVFLHDTARIGPPPAEMAGWPDWAAAHPGRITHPDPANFMGATFLKQALAELAPEGTDLSVPPTDATFAAATAPLWDWYDALRPHLWRGGTSFPASQFAQRQLLNDGEIDLSMSFDPASAAAAIRDGLLPPSVRVHVPAKGSIGNVSFVVIPFNAANPEGAKVVADALLDPEVQAHMQDIRVLGAFSVLDPGKLAPQARADFAALPSGPALPRLEDLGPVLPEPAPGWMTQLEAEWQRRYAR